MRIRHNNLLIGAACTSEDKPKTALAKARHTVRSAVTIRGGIEYRSLRGPPVASQLRIRRVLLNGTIVAEPTGRLPRTSVQVIRTVVCMASPGQLRSGWGSKLPKNDRSRTISMPEALGSDSNVAPGREGEGAASHRIRLQKRGSHLWS